MALGDPIPMLDATARVTGAMAYLINLRLPGMLAGAVARSAVPHARLTRVDPAKARAVEGVRAVVTGAEIAAHAWIGNRAGDHPVLAVDRVRYVGEPLAVVAAETIEAARAAAHLVEVTYDEMPAVFDAVSAARAGAPIVHEERPDNLYMHGKIRHGDLVAGFAAADVVFEDTFTSPTAQTTSLEPHGAIAQWNGDQLTVWSGTQAPYGLRRVLAQTFALPESAVRVIVPPVGGAYGGKTALFLEPIVAAIARRTGGRPVKLVLSRREEFVTVVKHAATITLKTGVRRDGTFTARQATLYWNGGAYASASKMLVDQGAVRSIGPYRFDAVHVDSLGLHTNMPPSGSYRGAMSSQTTWAYESQMDVIARRLGIDPVELRRRNLLRNGDRFATGEVMHDVHFVECLDAAVKALEVFPRRPDVGTKRHGRGAAVMMKNPIGTSKSEARVRYDSEGQLLVFTSTVEMGQGAHTALAQLAADALGVSSGVVRVIGPDTQTTPFDTSTLASRSTEMMGRAVQIAAQSSRAKLCALAAPLLATTVEKTVVKDSHVSAGGKRLHFREVLRRQQLTHVESDGVYETRCALDPQTGQGITAPQWHQGAGAAEVEVDCETGEVTVLRYHAAAWAGQVVNRRAADLQNQGNVIFGLGPTLMEEVELDGGRIANASLYDFRDYRIPSFRDIPAELGTVSIEAAGAAPSGIGEMTLPPVAPAIAAAVEDAVGVRIKDLPIRADKVRRALEEAKKR
ncbi:Xanthine dehydrogenase, molybdenum binding subunit protein [Minicystis rosea]|nr:Xanthine dehydrogenase, molybdenum binding subunit protein [Minicystis rosea]